MTRVGNLNLIMINAHLGHDVQLGDRCIISNNTMIAGHVVVGKGKRDYALLRVRN